MIDKVSGGSSYAASQRLQSLSQSNNLRSTSTLTAVQQNDTSSSRSSKAMQVFAVPQSTQSGGTTTKVPRGSLVDILA